MILSIQVSWIDVEGGEGNNLREGLYTKLSLARSAKKK